MPPYPEKTPFPKPSLLLSNAEHNAQYLAAPPSSQGMQGLVVLGPRVTFPPEAGHREGTTYPSGLRKESRARKIEHLCLQPFFLSATLEHTLVSVPAGPQQHVGGCGSLAPGLEPAGPPSCQAGMEREKHSTHLLDLQSFYCVGAP